MIDEIFKISKDVRYVAIYRDGKLETQTKEIWSMDNKRLEVIELKKRIEEAEKIIRNLSIEVNEHINR